jgi:hypothetical protein
LATTLKAPDRWSKARPEVPHGEDRVTLAQLKTTFSKIEAPIAEALIHRGWWLAGATMSAFQPDLLPADLPVWRDLPAGTAGPG